MSREEKNPGLSRRDFWVGGGAKAVEVAVGSAAAAVGVFSIPAVQRWVTYTPNSDLDGKAVPPIQPPEAYGLEGVKAVTLETAQGEDFLTWQSTELKPGKKTLVLFPGNFGHIGQEQYVNYIKAAQRDGYQIMAVEHVGFAGSMATSTQAGMFRGVEKVLNELQAKGIQPKDMSLVGISMGTTLAAHAANYIADSNAFRNDDKQHIRCLMVSGALNAGVILDDMFGPISFVPKAVWHEQFDTGKELQTISPSVGKRVYVTYLRGKDDKWTPVDQVEAHRQAADHLEFAGKEVVGQHFPEASLLLDELKEMGSLINARSQRSR